MANVYFYSMRPEHYVTTAEFMQAVTDSLNKIRGSA